MFVALRLLNRKSKRTTLYNIAAANFPFSPNNSSIIEGQVWYEKNEDERNEDAIENPNSDTLYIHKMAIEDRAGNKYVDVQLYTQLE